MKPYHSKNAILSAPNSGSTASIKMTFGPRQDFASEQMPSHELQEVVCREIGRCNVCPCGEVRSSSRSSSVVLIPMPMSA